MKCTTHHNACDCREEKMRFVCLEVIREHATAKNFLSGFGKQEKCNCQVCKTIRKLYKINIIESNGYDMD